MKKKLMSSSSATRINDRVSVATLPHGKQPYTIWLCQDASVIHLKQETFSKIAKQLGYKRIVK